jgi:hypothetical protein
MYKRGKNRGINGVLGVNIGVLREDYHFLRERRGKVQSAD